MPKNKRVKTRYVDINVKKGLFSPRFINFDKNIKEDYDLSDVSILRRILSNEKAKILYSLKNKKQGSIYSLAKELHRDFKSVSQDLKLLERFGFIEFHAQKKGKRRSLVPVLTVDKMEIVVNI